MSDDLAPCPPHVLGPTWRQTRDGRWHLPERSLGWGLFNFFEEYVLQPGGPRAGEMFVPTDEQARFILWWYAVDERGKFVYRGGVLRRMKGWGKDPLIAALSLAELCGPVAFDKFDAAGNAIGKRRGSAWVQLAAVSQEQTSNTFKLFPAMISKQLKDDFGLEINKTVIYTNDGCLIQGVTSSPLSMDGNRPTAVFLNETQWWMENNDGHEMANIIQGNVDKSSYGVCRSLSICNAHVPGLESVAERDYEAYNAILAGQAIDTGLLYDSIEAPAGTPVADIPSLIEDPDGHADGVARLRSGLLVARADSVWLDPDSIIPSILDIRNPISESRRKFLNQVNAPEDAWITPFEWDQCQRDVRLEPKDRITLGFDGSKSQDTSALVACRLDDGALFVIKSWNPEHFADGEVPRDDVDAMVHWAFGRYDVVGMRADMREFESYVDGWSRKYKKKMIVNATPGNPIAYDMRGQVKRFAFDCERFVDAVVEQELCHDGDKLLKGHVCNAVRHPTIYDAISIRKASKDSSRKIDAAVCAVLAFGARQEVLMSKKMRSRKATVLRGY